MIVSFLPAQFSPGRLLRPRLLPATIVAMSALFAVKTIILVQAAAEETGHSTPETRVDSSSAEQMAAHKPMSSGAVPIAVERKQAASRQAEISGSEAPPLSESERSLLWDLRHRRETLDARARDLDQRQAELDAAAHRLGERADQLSALQVKLEGLEAGRQHHAAENWSGLVRVYEAMKPRDAAAIFDALDMQVLLQVLDRMQDRRAAPVLAAMQPDRARLATQMLAEMRARSVGQPSTPPLSTNSKS